MTSTQVFRKTMPFVLAKLALGGAIVAIATILWAFFVGIGWLFGGDGMIIAYLMWGGCIGGIRFVFMHYFGYLVKAGHIAVIVEIFKTGQIPELQVEYGKNLVKERFLTTNVYFALDRLVASAVKQIQRVVDKAGKALDFIPGINTLTGITKFFIDISLGYIDECCLAWTFYNKEQSAYESAADGVVIYAQNGKVLLKNAAVAMIKALGVMAVLALFIFIPLGLMFKLLKWSGFVAFVLSCMIAWIVKFAIVDSYLMIEMMSTYMQVAPTTVITFDLYEKLCKISTSFKEMFHKGKKEEKPIEKETYLDVI